MLPHPYSIEASLLILLQYPIMKGEVYTMEFMSSPTLNLKKPLTISIQPKNLEMVALALYIMVRLSA